MDEQPRTVLIVEDLPSTRDWLATAVERAFPGSQIATAEDIATARKALAESWPDLVLVDLGLPDGDGTDLIAAIKQAAPATRCVVASTFGDDAHLFPALRAGADGYLTKDAEIDQLAEALAGILAGRPPLSPGIARRLMQHFQPQVQPDDGLSPREREVLTLIAKGYTVNRAAEMLQIASSTAAGYVKDIYRKLEISSRAEATLKAAEMGLVRPG